jgi:amino acid transporter
MSKSNSDTNVHQTSLPTAISNDISPHSTDGVNLASADLTKRNGCPTTCSEKTNVIDDSEGSIDGASKPVYDHTHRKLKPRHIQLIGIGGTIGTALYIQIGKTLMKGGPGSLFLAFSIW